MSKILSAVVLVCGLAVAVPGVLAKGPGEDGPRGSAEARENSNAAWAGDRDKGRDRAEDRRSDEEREHRKAMDKKREKMHEKERDRDNERR